MSYELTQQERESAPRLNAQERYDLLVSKLVEQGELWILRDDQGCMLLNTEEEESCIPVWPHPDFARQWATGDWAGAKPEAISLAVWLERWIPGMEEDDVTVAVFPTPDSMGTLAYPYELQASIEKKLAKQARRK